MKTIWKRPLVSDGIVEFPRGATILSVQTQAGVPTVWALVDPAAPLEAIPVAIYGTGHDLPDDPGRFIGTFQLHGGALVLHAFQPNRT